MIECATVKAVTGQQQHARAVHDQDQRQHEQQLIIAEQDVFDSMNQIGRGDLKRAEAMGIETMRGADILDAPPG